MPPPRQCRPPKSIAFRRERAAGSASPNPRMKVGIDVEANELSQLLDADPLRVGRALVVEPLVAAAPPLLLEELADRPDRGAREDHVVASELDGAERVGGGD